MANTKSNPAWPAWGGGAGSRMASAAAAKKLQTARDRQQARSASAAGFRPSEQPGTATSAAAVSWGFSAEPLEEERCPAATPAGSPTSLTPVKTEFMLSTRPAAAEGEAPAPLAPAFPAAPAPTSGLIGDARSALEALAGQLGAVARGSSLAASLGSSREEAFLAGVAVGLTLPTAGRQQAGRQRLLAVLLCFFALVVLVGCALLLGGFAQAHPQTVYYM